MLKEADQSKGLPDRYLTPHLPTEFELLGLLGSGDARIVSRKDIPEFSNFQSFKKYMQECKHTLTVIQEDDRLLDYVLNFFTTKQKEQNVTPFGCMGPWGIIEKAGTVRIDDWIIESRPGGKAARRGFNLINLRRNNNREVYHLMNMSYLTYVSSIDDIVPALKKCNEVGLTVPQACSIASMSRHALLKYSGSAFTSALSLGEDRISIFQAAANVMRGGRFEGIEFGTFSKGYSYDFKSAYPTKMAKLQHFGGRDKDRERAATVWRRWKGNYADLDSDGLAYAFLKIKEDVPYGNISHASHRVSTLVHKLIVYPCGEGVRYIGKSSYRSRKKQGLKVEVLDGWMGFVRLRHTPFAGLIDKLNDIHIVYPELAKAISVRLHGNCYATYDDVVEAIPNFGQIRIETVAMETYNPIYIADVVDSVFADITEVALENKAKGIIKFSVDGLISKNEIREEARPSNLLLKYSGPVSVFSDQLADAKGPEEAKWASRVDGKYLVTEQKPTGSMRSCFMPLNIDPLKQQARFDGNEILDPIKRRIGSSKRYLENENIDFLKESTPSRPFLEGDINDQVDSYVPYVVDEDNIIDEGV